MEKYLSLLARCPLFLGLEPNDLTAILGCLGAQEASWGRGEAILAVGEAASQIGVVLEGAVQIERIDYYGNRSVLGMVGAGELFGESFACADVAALPIDAVAASDCRVLLLDCRRLLHTCTNACDFHNRLIYNLMKILAAKNLAFHQKLEITAKRTTREKLLAYLLSEAARHQSERFTIPFDRQALADYLAVDRSGLSAEIGKLVKEGVLTTHKHEFVLQKQILS